MREIYAFYDTLEEAKSQCMLDEVNIVMVDLNAVVCCGQDGKTD